MGSNRKQPFGYQMEMGRVILQPMEAKVVRQIFSRYDMGESFATVTDWLRHQGVPYDNGKLWNKNMVARILEDVRYTGGSGYPPIIPAAKFESIREKRSKRSAPIRQTEAQKVLRQKCQKKIAQDAEEQILHLLNWLILYPQHIKVPAIVQKESPKIAEMEATLVEALAELPVDADTARKQIFALAAERYRTIDPSQYETERLRRLFQQAEPMFELDADLLRKAVTAVHIDSNGSVRLELKNKQIIQKKEKEFV